MVEAINPGFKERVDFSSFPSLAILDTEVVLEKIGNEWKIPEPFGRYAYNTDIFRDYGKEQFQNFCDDIFTKWINYCGGALRGIETVNRFKHEHVIAGDPADVDYYLFFRQALPRETDISSTINSIRDAFSLLISDETRERLGIEKSLEVPTTETRKKIDTLVKNMLSMSEWQSEWHFHYSLHSHF